MAKMTVEGVTYEGTPAELAEMVREFTTVAAESKEVPVVETLEIGDKVIVSGLSIYGADHDGQVGKFQGIDADGDYSVRFPDGYVRLYKRYQLEKVTEGSTLTAKVDELDSRVTALEKGDKPAYKTEKRAAKVGERILITNAQPSRRQDYSEGDIFKVTTVHACCAKDVKVAGQESFIEYAEYEVIVEETPAKPEPAQEIDHNGETYTLVSRKAQAGDVVFVTKDAENTSRVPNNAQYLVDADVRINGYKVYTNFHDRTEANVLVYEKKEPALKVGDYVRVKDGAESRHGDIDAGTIVKVTDVNPFQPYEVRVDLLDGTDYDCFSADDLELVDEKVVTFAKIGRKLNEFKKGDIVRVVKDGMPSHLSGHEQGDIGVVVHGDTDGRPMIEVDGYGQYSFAELIAPVESRVDNGARSVA